MTPSDGIALVGENQELEWWNRKPENLSSPVTIIPQFANEIDGCSYALITQAHPCLKSPCIPLFHLCAFTPTLLPKTSVQGSRFSLPLFYAHSKSCEVGQGERE